MKTQPRITNPDELNKRLQHSSPVTWVILGLVMATLGAFLAWSFLGKLTVKIGGTAEIKAGEVSLKVKAADTKKLAVGQKVIIAGQEGEILSLSDSQITVSSFSLSDGEYQYTLVLGQKRPVDFWFGE